MNPIEITRRNLLSGAALGVGGLVLADLLGRDGLLQGAEAKPRVGLHHEAKAKRIVHVFLGGGLSQVDTFDYKPALYKHHNQPMPEPKKKIDVFNSRVGKLHRSHFKFKQRGKSGLWVSDLFPHLAGVADELTVFNGMVAETGNHIPGIFQANTGFRQMGFPAMGSWLSYGLGSESEELPAFVVLPDKVGYPNAAGGAFNWTSGFLPAKHQGVPFASKGEVLVPDLTPATKISPQAQRARLDLLRRLNAKHLEEQTQTDPLTARIRSYELAAQMQSAIPKAGDFSKESAHVQKAYGLENKECSHFARNCLLARRLLERGVRCVQLWSGDGVSWDSHNDVPGTGYKGHLGMARQIDRPVAALIAVLRQRGMLDDTLVLITTEFGRTPFAQAPKGKLSKGRDHNQTAYTNVVAGAGLKKGITHGSTDEFGYAAVDRTTIYDFHATMLHLMGIDHERLTFYHNGIQRRLTNVHGEVIEAVLD